MPDSEGATEHEVYIDALRRQYNTVMVNDVVARTAWETAVNCGASDTQRLMAVIVGLSAAKKNVLDELKRTIQQTR